MYHEHVVGRDRPQNRTQSGAPLLLEGRLLVVARGLWLLLATLSVGLFLAGAPFHYRQLLESCVNGCAAMQLSGPEVRALQELGLSTTSYATYLLGLALVWALAYVTVALVIFWRRSDEWMALLAGLWLVTFGTTGTYPALAAGRPLLEPLLLFLDQLGWVVLLPLFLFTFPNGRFVPRWTRWLLITFFIVGIVGNALEHLFPPLFDYELVSQVLWFSTMLAGIGTQVYRYRRVSDPVQRQQTRWVVAGLVVTAASIAGWFLLLQSPVPLGQPGLPTVVGNVLEMTLVTSAFVIVALTMGYSILRYRLWDIDLIINRALIWGLLSAIVVGTYALTVGVLGALLQWRDSFLTSMIAAGLVAVLFHPLRQRVQRGVNRLMYGKRDEPYAVLSQLGRRLEATLAPWAVLPTIVETVAQALRLPYVALTLERDGKFQVAASTGQVAPESLVLPLSYQGQTLGQLICGVRSGDRPFSGQERRLLQDIARQAGVALHAARLAEDVQRSRERLVIAREEERRRIRRDLHDGLGPALASQTLKIGSARALLRQDSEAAEAMLRELEQDSMAAMKDVRRLVYDLRPPALDELGLLRAMQQDAPRRPGLDVIFELPPALPTLTAALEVAVYRIVREALANVARHSTAGRAVVSLEAGEELCLTVADDGQGLPTDYRAGVGLGSMRERAEELGGTFQLESAPGHGVTIKVQLPLRREES